MQFIQDDLSKNDRKVILRRIVADGNGHRFRIVIVSDPYDFQSSASVDVWSKPKMAWSNVTNIDYGSMQTPAGVGHKQDWKDLSRFEEDYDYLLGVAMQLVGI